MAVFLDKLKQRGVDRFKGPTAQTIPTVTPPESPLAAGVTDINKVAPRPQPATAVSQRVAGLPEKGPVGSLPQFQGIKKRIVADLPSKTQLEGIQGILSGQSIGNPVIENFVKGMAAQGKNPEEIRQAFINQQKTSKSPLVIL